ncbi:hypothetical protein J8273_7076 [Carpediemonas membranifera]|uniref:Uncharacterized protein n=1 Tax=Carpediemonas membranifera TaxID=201153 RepID=A0A8J6E1M3_9EUKA|nr:hypothetical protein J8273_7076 [Carpediemonas membranifera]|eukprot:KAG9390817.1 hypothetical protein J8273_7076 [Carpediemonas membranifera]
MTADRALTQCVSDLCMVNSSISAVLPRLDDAIEFFDATPPSSARGDLVDNLTASLTIFSNHIARLMTVESRLQLAIRHPQSERTAALSRGNDTEIRDQTTQEDDGILHISPATVSPRLSPLSPRRPPLKRLKDTPNPQQHKEGKPRAVRSLYGEMKQGNTPLGYWKE